MYYDEERNDTINSTDDNNNGSAQDYTQDGGQPHTGEPVSEMTNGNSYSEASEQQNQPQQGTDHYQEYSGVQGENGYAQGPHNPDPYYTYPSADPYSGTYDNAHNDPYAGMSAKDYKQNIKKMKREYKQFQKDQKLAAKAERYSQSESGAYQKNGIGAGTAFILSLLTSFILFVVIFGLIAFFPSKEKSFLSSLYNSNASAQPGNNYTGETLNPSGNDVEIGDQTVSKGDNVTINIEGGASGYAEAVYAKAANSVVGIAVSQLSGSKWNQYESVVSMGSGIVYSADGIIVTNCHVVEYAIDDSSSNGINTNCTIRVYFKTDLTEWAYVTEIIGYDAVNDIAVLKVNARNLQPIEFADSDNLTTGETAITIGSPGGLTYMNSISEGILSGLNRTVTTDTTTVYDLIQTTAAINPGNSGGALLNKEGKLIGLCVIKIVSTEYEGMGFAINSNTVKTIVESIREYGYYNKPVLGITVDTTYTSEIAAQEGWKAGAYVQDVTPGAAAAKAGIQAEDIVTKMNDTVISSFAEIRRFLLTCKPGDTISIEVYRPSTNETLKFEVTLDATAPN